MKFFDKTWKLALSGTVAGLLVALLAIHTWISMPR